MSHMKGKLHTGGVFNPTRTNPTVNLWSETPADCQSGEIVAFGVNPANARRLVACWNACDGIETESLEKALSITDQPMRESAIHSDLIAEDCNELISERDELVKALRQCQNALEPYDDVKPRDWKTDREKLAAAHQNAHAILARYPKGRS